RPVPPRSPRRRRDAPPTGGPHSQAQSRPRRSGRIPPRPRVLRVHGRPHAGRLRGPPRRRPPLRPRARVLPLHHGHVVGAPLRRPLRRRPRPHHPPPRPPARVPAPPPPRRGRPPRPHHPR